MSDSFSTLLNLRFQQTGGNSNTWGDLLNTDVFTPLENAIAATLSHAVTGGSLDLSATPLVEQVHKFTGVLTSDETVTIPSLSKRFLIDNATTGAFFLLVKTSGGTAICVPQGTRKAVYCDGTNVYREDAKEVGEVKSFATTSLPSGFLECDGSAIKRTKAPDLYAVLGTTWGAGNGVDDFVLPDFKTAGRFLRSRTGSVTVGTLQAADIAAHNHTASATTSVTITSLSIASDGVHSHTIAITDTHQHGLSASTGTTPNVAGGGFANVGSVASATATTSTTGSITAASNSTGAHTHSGSTGTATATTSVTVNNSTGTETRPVNASVIMAVRY
jgi:microcystin-dependent protein